MAPTAVYVVLFEVYRNPIVWKVFDSEEKAIAHCIEQTTSNAYERLTDWCWRAPDHCFSITKLPIE